MVGPDGRALLVRPGTVVPQGAQTTSGVNQSNTVTSPTRRAGEQGTIISEAGDNLIHHIEQNKDLLGNLGSYWKQFTNQTPIADPTAAFLMAQLASFAALQPALHGFRSHQALREFENIIGGIPKNPDALIAAIKGIQETAGIVTKVGKGGGRGGGQQGGPAPGATMKVKRISDGQTGTIESKDFDPKRYEKIQ